MISDEGFAKKEHLLKSRDFRVVYKSRRRFSAGGVVLYLAPNAKRFNRLGFSISSRSISLATKRNKVRRLFKEVYRKNKKGLKKGFDIVIVIKKEPLGPEASYKETEKLFLKLARGIGLAA